MSKTYFLIFSLFLVSVSCKTTSVNVIYPYTEDSSIIRIKAFYKGYGKVFSSHMEANRDFFGNQYSTPIIPTYKEDFKLTPELIIETERLFFQEYNNALNEKYGLEENREKDPQRFFRHHFRQYLGYINVFGEKEVFFVLMNFKNKRQANKYFRGWDQNIALGTGPFFEKNERRFVVNLCKRSVRVY